MLESLPDLERRDMFTKPPFWGRQGMGVNFQKYHFARNWMTYPDMHRKFIFANGEVEEYQFIKIIYLIGIEWKIQICT